MGKRSLIFSICLLPCLIHAAELHVGKVCPVSYQNKNVGILVFSKEWYHSSRTNARYIPGDNATGIGVEIHFFASEYGNTEGENIAACDRYRLLQIRESNVRLVPGEKPRQIDVPDSFTSPFYDASPLEHGYGVHHSPADTKDKPWDSKPQRAATVSIYDTPYVSDSYGIEGEDINIRFETCVICERDSQYDQLLSCGTWGYKREYMGGQTGWAEPESFGAQCQVKASGAFTETLNGSNRIEYSYWINWR